MVETFLFAPELEPNFFPSLMKYDQGSSVSLQNNNNGVQGFEIKANSFQQGDGFLKLTWINSLLLGPPLSP